MPYLIYKSPSKLFLEGCCHQRSSPSMVSVPSTNTNQIMDRIGGRAINTIQIAPCWPCSFLDLVSKQKQCSTKWSVKEWKIKDIGWYGWHRAKPSSQLELASPWLYNSILRYSILRYREVTCLCMVVWMQEILTTSRSCVRASLLGTFTLSNFFFFNVVIREISVDCQQKPLCTSAYIDPENRLPWNGVHLCVHSVMPLDIQLYHPVYLLRLLHSGVRLW